MRDWCYPAKDDWQLVPQVIYLVIKCEARFCKIGLKIFKCTWFKCWLETNLASSVKPSNIVLNKNNGLCVFLCKTKSTNNRWLAYGVVLCETSLLFNSLCFVNHSTEDDRCSVETCLWNLKNCRFSYTLYVSAVLKTKQCAVIKLGGLNFPKAFTSSRNNWLK